MNIYQVTFEIEKPKEGLQVKTKNIEAMNPGSAFHKCAKANPGCKLITARISRTMHGRQWWIDYDPPSEVKIIVEHRPRLVQEEFTEIKSLFPQKQSSKKRKTERKEND